MVYRIAGLNVYIEGSNIFSNMEPFRLDREEEAAPDMKVTFGNVERPSGAEYITGLSNDAGEVSLYLLEDYYLEIVLGGRSCTARCSRDFSRILTNANPDDEGFNGLVNSVVRIAFSQRILFFKGCLMHSSTVVLEGKGYMFLGKSGTGKSTHSRLWIKEFGAELLNDDNPVARMEEDGSFRVYGTPWSGKTPCYRNASFPLEALVRLEQGETNNFKRLYKVKAWAEIFPSCSLICQDESLYLHFVETANAMALGPKVGHLVCRPDSLAAHICRRGISGK